MNNDVLNLTRVALEDVQRAFDIKANLYAEYVGDLLEDEYINEVVNARDGIDDWKDATPLGGPGTVLNGIVLYCLIRHYGLDDVLETGVSGGFYSSFMLAALMKKRLPFPGPAPLLTSIELSDNKDEVGKLIPDKLKSNADWDLHTGTDSLQWLRENDTLDFDFYCHDSLHTLDHMLKELAYFQGCEKDEFFIYIDDQSSEDFWNTALKINAFNKPGYDVTYISGKESRLQGHLGGFLKYKKVA